MWLGGRAALEVGPQRDDGLLRDLYPPIIGVVSGPPFLNPIFHVVFFGRTSKLASWRRYHPMHTRYDARHVRLPLVVALALTVFGCAPADAGPSSDTQGIEFPATNRPDIRGVRGAVSSDQPLATAAAFASVPARRMNWLP